MKNECKKAALKHLRYLMMLSLMGGSMGLAIAEDAAVTPPPPVTTPAVVQGDAGRNADTWDSNPAMDPERVKALATTYGVTEKQVLTMRQTDKMGWGEIRNLLLISQRVATDSARSETPITREQALTQVLKQRQSGMGIGQIANSYNVRLGDLQREDRPDKPGEAKGVDKPDKLDKVDKVDKPEKLDKPEKPEKVDKPEKIDKPEKVEKPEKPEKPEKVDKPEKPEKPDNPGKGN